MKKILLIGIFVMFLMICPVFAEENLTNYQESVICLSESYSIYEELNASGFSIVRVNDTLTQAQNMFDAQEVLDERAKPYDFSLVIPYCEEIFNLKENAFESRDEFTALLKFYNESLNEDMDTSSVDVIIEDIKNEIESERYEKVRPLVDDAYEKIINIKSEHTTLNLFYRTTTRSLKDFIYENWIYLILGFVALFILFFVYKNTIFQVIIKKKIKNLEKRKKVIKDLIKKTQKQYFDHGKMSEGNYMIRVKKFGELIRDIDRQIPLLQESLIKILKKKKEGKDKIGQVFDKKGK
jgi:hypothetical protein